jgi:hypothetical protein
LTHCNKLKENKDEVREKETFSASRGWFYNFRKRMGLHNVQTMGESASADSNAAERFPRELKEIIEQGEYRREQIFNVDETGLFWKKMPSRTYLAEKERSQPGYKVSKDRLTLLLGGNASGDLKLKPLLIYRAQNPRVLRDIPKNALPVIWKANKKAWVTRQIFEEWFTTYFCPTVEITR